ncbi:MAG: methyltransferase dimerization domain-containing protein [Pyrinomonadaceae bacterium]
MDNLTPARIMEVGMAFWPAKVLLSAVKLGLFTRLGAGSMTGAELQNALGLHSRSNPDFFDTLVALKFLERDGDGPDSKYRNTPETSRFLDKTSPAFIGGFLEMANDRLYPFWGDLTAWTRWPASRSATLWRWQRSLIFLNTRRSAMSAEQLRRWLWRSPASIRI